MNKKILVINALSALRGGGQTYIINFLNFFDQENIKVILLVNKKNIDLFQKYTSHNIELYEAKWASKSIIHRVVWERYRLPKLLVELNSDVYYAPGGTMITKVYNNITTVTALRNMLPFDDQERKRFPLFSYSRFKLWLLRFVFLYSYRIANKVVFISEHSKLAVKNYISDIDKKSVVISHGLNAAFLKGNVNYELPKPLVQNEFYLYVSILDVYKAQKEIIKEWKQLKNEGFKYPLVLAGPQYNEYGEEVLNMIKELDLSESVIYLGAVDYEKLPGLYSSARALIFASSCECCPNILLEKLAAGKAVICSSLAPMPEFAEDAVAYFNPYVPNSLSSQIKFIESNIENMQNLGFKAKQQALKFNWKETIEKTVNFLTE